MISYQLAFGTNAHTDVANNKNIWKQVKNRVSSRAEHIPVMVACPSLKTQLSKAHSNLPPQQSSDHKANTLRTRNRICTMSGCVPGAPNSKS